MKQNNLAIEGYRVHMHHMPIAFGNNGSFVIYYKGRELLVIASDGGGWDHVSVSLRNEKTPNWADMCFIKDLFFEETETVVQYHPKKSEYVNNHSGCLHMWKKQNSEFELPPSIFVGIK